MNTKKSGFLPNLEHTDAGWSPHPTTAHLRGNMAYELGAATRRGIAPSVDRKDRQIFTRPQNFFRDVLPSTVGGGAIAALTAGLLKARTPYRWLAGLAGAGYGTYRADRKWDPVMNKKSSYKLDSGFTTQEEALKREIIAKLQSAPGVNFSEANQLASGVARLNASQLQQLTRVLSTVSGAAIGSVIMRFLAKSGVIGTITGGLLGGLVGNALTRPRPHVDFFGRPVRQTDLFGRPIF
jgi:hypothetical protein